MLSLGLGRFSLRQLTIVCGTITLLYILWSLFTSHHDDLWYMGSSPCQQPESQLRNIEELTIRVHHILNEAGVEHFLCFGSLWGAVRIGKTLPWDTNLDICTVDTEIKKVDAVKLYDLFAKQDLSFVYSRKDGVYEINYRDATAFLTVFHRFYTDMERTGWSRTLFPFLYDNLHNFPARLIRSPLPTTKFHKMDFPVPHEDFELQKYLYPGDWWKEMKPLGC